MSDYKGNNNNNDSIDDVQTYNYTAYHISNDNANYDNDTVRYTTIFDPNTNITGTTFFFISKFSS